jgi:hypothetical protein
MQRRAVNSCRARPWLPEVHAQTGILPALAPRVRWPVLRTLPQAQDATPAGPRRGAAVVAFGWPLKPLSPALASTEHYTVCARFLEVCTPRHKARVPRPPRPPQGRYLTILSRPTCTCKGSVAAGLDLYHTSGLNVCCEVKNAARWLA